MLGRAGEVKVSTEQNFPCKLRHLVPRGFGTHLDCARLIMFVFSVSLNTLPRRNLSYVAHVTCNNWNR